MTPPPPTTWIEYYMSHGWSERQIAAYLIIPKFQAALSIVGSGYVIQDVLRNPRKRSESTYHRIMVALSTSDIIYSFFTWLLTSWPFPKGSQMFARGSVVFCDVAGFFHLMSIQSTPLLKCSLATYFLVQLKYNWVDSRIKALEKWLLVLPWIVGLIPGIVGLATKTLGPYGFICW